MAKESWQEIRDGHGLVAAVGGGIDGSERVRLRINIGASMVG
jgi:hypothetical protein